jgi:NodT family efflux transporter outer membrane factor (OMF) lipoprotein
MSEPRNKMSPRLRVTPRTAYSILLCGGLAGCLVGPNYSRPSAPVSPAFKEAAGWAPAQPFDAASRLDWWTAFGDPILDNLEQRVDVSNQTLAAAEAAYRQAHALVAQDRAALFPTVALDGGVTTGGGGANHPSGTTYSLGLGGTWEPDLWGAVRRNVESAKAGAQSSAALVANARLSAQTELAADYVQLRLFDEEKRIFDATVEAFARTLVITQNKYHAGVAARGDVLSAQSSLDGAKAVDVDLDQQRAKTEHAIAILAGQTPASLTLPPAPWTLTLPQIPAGVPSTLLQRRPDVASAERSAASANALIGVQVAAYYPNLTLTGQGGFQSNELGSLFSASNTLWSVGASVAETIFDAGLRKARVAQARAAYDEAVANYRQTVLTALQQVEDNLAAQRVLGGELMLRHNATVEAAGAEAITLNQYKAGTVDFTAVTLAEQTTLSSRTAEVALESARLTTAVDLIAALGGGWTVATPLPPAQPTAR